MKHNFLRIASLLAAIALVAGLATSCQNPMVSADATEVASSRTAVTSPAWKAWTAYAVNAVVSHNGQNYACVQAHTSQPDWEPQNVPALWKKTSATTDGEKPVVTWQARIAYKAGEVVYYNADAQYYKVVQNHTSQANWLPPQVPALYQNVQVQIEKRELDPALLPALEQYYATWKQKYISRYVKAGFGGSPTPDYIEHSQGSFVYYNGPFDYEGSTAVTWLGSTDGEESASVRRITTSEAHGYGMVISAVMGDAYTFGELYRFFRKFYLPEQGGMHWALELRDGLGSSRIEKSEWAKYGDTYVRPGKMVRDWYDQRQDTSIPDPAYAPAIIKEGSDSTATDGDVDIAYALLLAYEKWNVPEYKDFALQIISKLGEVIVHGELKHLKIGSWAKDGVGNSSDWVGFDYSLATRPSDFALGTIKKFAQYGNESLWNAVYNQTVKAISDAQDSNTGLMPDFLYYDYASGKYKAVPSPDQALVQKWKDKNGTEKVFNTSGSKIDFLENEWDHMTYYNAARFPWRISQEKNLLKSSALDSQIATIANWGKAEYERATYVYYGETTVNDKEDWQMNGIFEGYSLDGKVLPEKNYPSVLFTSCYLPAAKAAGSTWFNTLWQTWFANPEASYQIGGYYGISKNFHNYFGDTVRLMAALDAATK